eukprot:COSAG02_NODE_604_length_19688_cov_77.556231_14_plen_96_part_00
MSAEPLEITGIGRAAAENPEGNGSSSAQTALYGAYSENPTGDWSLTAYEYVSTGSQQVRFKSLCYIAVLFSHSFWFVAVVAEVSATRRRRLTHIY